MKLQSNKIEAIKDSIKLIPIWPMGIESSEVMEYYAPDGVHSYLGSNRTDSLCPGVDLREGREHITDLLILANIMMNTGGKFGIVVQESSDRQNWTSRGSISLVQYDANFVEAHKAFVVTDLKRYFRIYFKYYSPNASACAITMLALGLNSKRFPVHQVESDFVFYDFETFQEGVINIPTEVAE